MIGDSFLQLNIQNISVATPPAIDFSLLVSSCLRTFIWSYLPISVIVAPKPVLISVDNNAVSLHGSYRSSGNGISLPLHKSNKRWRGSCRRDLTSNSLILRHHSWNSKSLCTDLFLQDWCSLYSWNLNGNNFRLLFSFIWRSLINSCARPHNWIEFPQFDKRNHWLSHYQDKSKQL